MKKNKNKTLISGKYNDVFFVNLLMSFESKKKGNTFVRYFHLIVVSHFIYI